MSSSPKLIIQTAKQFPPLTAEEEQKLIHQIRAGSNTAREKLINSNLRMVINIARGYKVTGMELDDLIQEGYLGLIKAAEKSDPTKEARFSTYAAYYVHGRIKRAKARKARTIPVPTSTFSAIGRYFKTQQALLEKLERSPSDEEIADALGITLAQIRRLQKNAEIPISMEAPIDEEGGSTLGDFIPDRQQKNPEQVLIEKNSTHYKKKLYHQALEKLTEHERAIILARHPEDPDNQKTPEEVSVELGITLEQVAQIEKAALGKIRKAIQFGHPTLLPPLEENWEDELANDPFAVVITDIPKSRLKEALKYLTQRQREIITLMFMGETQPTVAEVTAQLNTTTGNIYGNCNNAMNRLRKVLGRKVIMWHPRKGRKRTLRNRELGSRKTSVSLPKEMQAQESVLITDIPSETLQEATQQLSRRQQEILTLMYLGETPLAPKEVAEKLQISPVSAHNARRIALKELGNIFRCKVVTPDFRKSRKKKTSAKRAQRKNTIMVTDISTRQLQEAVLTLPRRQREVMSLSFLEERPLSIAAIAKKLNIAEPTVYYTRIVALKRVGALLNLKHKLVAPRAKESD